LYSFFTPAISASSFWKELRRRNVVKAGLAYAVAEIEGDLLKAILTGDLDKIRHKYRLLLGARSALVEAEGKQV